MDSLAVLMQSAGDGGPLAVLRGLGGLGGLGLGLGLGAGAAVDQNVEDALNVLLGLVSPRILELAEAKLSEVLSGVRDPACANALSAYVDGVVSLTPQFWALRMLDASGKLPQSAPSGATALLGDYDQCIGTQAPAFAGQYCLLTGCFSPGGRPCDRDPLEGTGRLHAALQNELASGEPGLNWTALLHASRGLPLRLGLCLPSACGAPDALSLVRAAAEVALPMATDFVSLEMGAAECRTRGDSPFQGLDGVALILLFLIGLMVGVGTIYDYFTKGRGRRGRRSLVLMAFSARRNLRRLVDTRVADGVLPAVDGVRVLSMLWIVICHSLFVASHLPMADADRLPEYLRYRSLALAGAAFLSVDTFLVLSGTLVSYIYLRRSAMGRSVNLFGYYLHRIARLFPSLGLILFLQSTIILKLRDGPLWRLQPDNECPETWWYIMLQICNYFRPERVQCMVHLWYLSLDWQLYALAPLALLWLRRRPRRVLAALLALGAAGTALRFCVAYRDGHLVPWGGHYSRRTMEALYFPTHMRFVPYLMGLALGYEIHRINNLKYPPSLSKGQLAALQVAWPLLLAACVAWVHRHMPLERPPAPLAEALHLALVDALWAAGVGALLYLCALGRGGPVGALLSMGWWRPLGCLSFGVYLLHMPLYNSFIQDTRQLIRPDIWRLFVAGVGCFCLAHVPALALWLGVDVPVARILTDLFEPRDERKRYLVNGTGAGDKSAKDLDYIQISKGDKKDLNI